MMKGELGGRAPLSGVQQFLERDRERARSKSGLGITAEAHDQNALKITNAARTDCPNFHLLTCVAKDLVIVDKCDAPSCFLIVDEIRSHVFLVPPRAIRHFGRIYQKFVSNLETRIASNDRLVFTAL
jgi:hypothetical protein